MGHTLTSGSRQHASRTLPSPLDPCPPLSPFPPPSHRFIIGPAVINTHTHAERIEEEWEDGEG